MKFKEGQLLIRINHPETDNRRVEKGGIVKISRINIYDCENDLLVKVVKSKNLPTGKYGIVHSSHYKAFHIPLLKRKSKWLTY